ncbi:S8 family serine peptidase [Chitinimonas sp. BJB300]|uniref:S8 family serine peptidase n=1 Tax=Chitinimonas sp. BJB300 TaxID=1559339 RepID=UPI000C0D27D0|nr:S8 family serine peptidase [Chitinimonas sp. BJB300]PHV10155.1 hypothetical protein CSQ89_17770 [Chitinimonas sp. BJB300]TSJ86122.1 S8 family serine peptidase [Chitinimonas sp. BJB300]
MISFERFVRVKVVLFVGVALTSCGGETNTTDPLYPYQWHLKNTGQAVFADIRPKPGIDLNMGTLYEQGITGKGITIGIVEDDGPYSEHEDLKANLRVEGSTYPLQENDHAKTHATAMSAIIAAVAGNGIGGRGVAPSAKIAVGMQRNIPVRVINNSAGGQPPLFLPNSDSDDASLHVPLTPLIVKAAGNSFLEIVPGSEAECDNATRSSGVSCVVANTDLLSNMPIAIVVGAVNALGEKASYSSTGSVLWVSGLGGEKGWQRQYLSSQEPIPEKAQRYPARYFSPAIVTADGPGCTKGLNKQGKQYNALDSGSPSLIDPSCNYTAMANGTSSATPMVSGVIALMLQVNPRLSWRDIKYILATTARKVDEQQQDIRWNDMTLETGWTRNAAGHLFSNWYGFGLVDATRAVDMARNFIGLPNLYIGSWQADSGTAVPIPYRREDAGFSPIDMRDNVKIETVQLQLKTTSKNPGNLRIVLISPSGTRSTILPALTYLIPTPDGFSIDLTASNAFLDEPSQGRWQLQIVDMVEPSSETSQTLTFWKLRVLGRELS